MPTAYEVVRLASHFDETKKVATALKQTYPDALRNCEVTANEEQGIIVLIPSGDFQVTEKVCVLITIFCTGWMAAKESLGWPES